MPILPDRCGIGGGAGLRDCSRRSPARRCRASCRTRPRRRAAARRGGDRRALSGATAGGAARRPARLLLRPRRCPQPARGAARQGAHGGAAPRHHLAQRSGDAARRDDALRDLLDARRLCLAADHRQHLIPPALLGRARPVQPRPLRRTAHPGRCRCRVAASRRAVGLRNRPERLRLDLPARRADGHRPRHGVGRRSGDGMACRRSRARRAASSFSAGSFSASAN